MHKIIFTNSAADQLKKINPTAQRLIVEKIKKLNPSSQNNNIKKLTGCDNLYRLRVGDYRVIYQIRNLELIILVLKIGHRKDVYKEIFKTVP